MYIHLFFILHTKKASFLNKSVKQSLFFSNQNQASEAKRTSDKRKRGCKKTRFFTSPFQGRGKNAQNEQTEPK